MYALAAAVLEELLDGIRQRRGLPQAAEVLLELGEALDQDRAIDRTFEGAADEGGDAGRHALDRVVRSALFGDLDAGDAALGHGSLVIVTVVLCRKRPARLPALHRAATLT